jgi:hypothetical protein
MKLHRLLAVGLTTAFLALTTLFLAHCNKEKAAIDARSDATKTAIDDEKRGVNAAAENAIKQADLNAAENKADIEAGKGVAQAQLDAEKKKADAEAAAAKAKVDAAAK